MGHLPLIHSKLKTAIFYRAWLTQPTHPEIQQGNWKLKQNQGIFSCLQKTRLAHCLEARTGKEENWVFYVIREAKAGSEKDRPSLSPVRYRNPGHVRTLAQKLWFSTIRLAATLPLSGIKERVGRKTTKLFLSTVPYSTTQPRMESKVNSSPLWRHVDRSGKLFSQERTTHLKKITQKIQYLELCQLRFLELEKCTWNVSKWISSEGNNSISLHSPRWIRGPTDGN